jgi:hypothetical protein
MIKTQKDLIGQRFGRLLVIEQLEDHIKPSGIHISQWLCQCDCGSDPIVVKRYNLINGIKTHCGCLSNKKLPNDDIVVDLYVNQHKTCKEICIMYGMSDKSIDCVSRILKRNGIIIPKQGRGPDSYGWKGGKIIKGCGYYGIWNPDHERADNQGYVYEHTLVYESNTGVLPQKGEVIHHIDLDKLNNDFSNLFLCDHKAHLVCHRSIEKLIKPLMQNNIIYFENGEYKIYEEYINQNNS